MIDYDIFHFYLKIVGDMTQVFVKRNDMSLKVKNVYNFHGRW